MYEQDPILADLVIALSLFVSGAQRSQEFVRDEIGGALEMYPDGDGFPNRAVYEELEVATACYRPGGGQFMYDEEQMEAICERALSVLNPGM